MKILKLTFAVLIIAILNVNAQNNWVQKSNFGGTARSYALSFTALNKGYIGFGQGQLSDLWEYNPTTDAWTLMASFPGVQRERAFGFSLNDRIYYGGGESGSGQVLFDFWEYNPTSNSWTQKANLNNSYNWKDASATTANGVGVVLRPAHLDLYNPTNDTWQALSYTMTNRLSGFAFNIGNLAYFGGGWDGNSTTSLNDFWSYNTSTNIWTQLPNLPNAIQLTTTFVIGNRGYICTGDNGVTLFNNLWCFDVGLNQWIQKANFIGSGRVAASGFSLNNKGYCGLGSNGTSALNDFYEYTPDTITTGINDLLSFGLNNIYYNESENSIHLYLEAEFKIPDNNFKLINLSGAERTFQVIVNPDEIVLKLNQRQNGISVLRIQNQRGVLNKKLLLSR